MYHAKSRKYEARYPPKFITWGNVSILVTEIHRETTRTSSIISPLWSWAHHDSLIIFPYGAGLIRRISLFSLMEPSLEFIRWIYAPCEPTLIRGFWFPRNLQISPYEPRRMKTNKAGIHNNQLISHYHEPGVIREPNYVVCLSLGSPGHVICCAMSSF